MERKTDGKMIGAIREVFHNSGLSIKQLAERAGLPYASCHGLVTRKYDATLSTVERVCEVLGLELAPRRMKRKGK